MLLKSKACEGTMLHHTANERCVLGAIKHPFIVQLHYAFSTAQQLVLVLQYCPGGNLQDLLVRLRHVPMNLARFHTAQVLSALCYLHGENVVYRDLKPENVVLDKQGNALLCDFGRVKDSVKDWDGAKSLDYLAFIAPEVFHQKRCYSKAVDIYGLGVLLYILLVGKNRYTRLQKGLRKSASVSSLSRDRVLTNIKSGELRIPSHVPKVAAAFIRATMRCEPMQRLGADNTSLVKEHEFYEGMDWNALLRRELPVPEQVAAPPRAFQRTRSLPEPFLTTKTFSEAESNNITAMFLSESVMRSDRAASGSQGLGSHPTGEQEADIMSLHCSSSESQTS
jgi:serine/threonine protein kinase